MARQGSSWQTKAESPATRRSERLTPYVVPHARVLLRALAAHHEAMAWPPLEVPEKSLEEEPLTLLGCPEVS